MFFIGMIGVVGNLETCNKIVCSLFPVYFFFFPDVLEETGVTGNLLTGKKVDFDTYTPVSIPRDDIHFFPVTGMQCDFGNSA